ncbi:hypothetical protein NDU88_009652 [Pleurodeles waltl]|uniref:Secreted protein n=1 Tax=Pleurodeles waltl TaxID=8319 RepID=A0AAV7RVT9_PLEWA|nr:hypothetical protein NDU88_009652 [Pleurodeles waltl]
MDSWVVIAWACFCWCDGRGFVFNSLSLTFGVVVFCGCLNFGEFRDVGHNSCCGIPLLCFGGLLHGGSQRRLQLGLRVRSGGGARANNIGARG